jgi:hypothetical protein
MAVASWDRYAYISDGYRFFPLVKIVVRGSDVFILDPNVPDAGKISYHASGALSSGQPKFDPSVIYGWLGAVDGVHGYQYIARRATGSHGFEHLLESSTSPGPSKRRPGPVLDIREQPPGTRFLEIAVGVRWPPTCHDVSDVMDPSRRFLREETPIANRLLVISA